ncbi:MAG TPA: hypothetical protein VHK90_07540 [Thermoanaerobaculia bacterium]|nr:hypothetical protein [Thermoanaerobaculia bacterium]
MTIRTTNEHAKTTRDHTIVIAGDRARATNERDVWRIFDTKANTVTFVDDIDRTVRTEPLTAFIARRRKANAESIPPYFRRVAFRRMNESRVLAGASARRHVIESGGYRRELWLAEHPAIPRGLFAMMHASETPTSPLAPMMRAVDEALMATRGFPLLDRTEVPFADGTLVVERTVMSVVQRDVPEAMLAVPRGYKDLTPKPPAPK